MAPNHGIVESTLQIARCLREAIIPSSSDTIANYLEGAEKEQYESDRLSPQDEKLLRKKIVEKALNDRNLLEIILQGRSSKDYLHIDQELINELFLTFASMPPKKESMFWCTNDDEKIFSMLLESPVPPDLETVKKAILLFARNPKPDLNATRIIAETCPYIVNQIPLEFWSTLSDDSYISELLEEARKVGRKYLAEAA